MVSHCFFSSEIIRFSVSYETDAHGEIQNKFWMKYFAIRQNVKLNPPTRRKANFTCLRHISYCEAIFHPPVKVDLTEKDRFYSESVFFWRRRRDSTCFACTGLDWGSLRPISLKNSRTGLFFYTLDAHFGFKSLLFHKKIQQPYFV